MMRAQEHVGLYLHIPFCQRKCPYCAFYSVPIGQRSPDRFADALLKEIDLYEIAEPLETLYIGGGSPTCLPKETLIRLVRSLKQRFGRIEEFTVECNPAQVDLPIFEQLGEAGVNRVSIGAQSFDAGELKILKRLHSPRQITEAVAIAHQAGFTNIGLDLIFGLPRSNLMAWQNTLQQAIALEVQHVSAYSLTIEKSTPFERAMREGTLTMTDEVTERTMYELARIQLQRGRWKQYEISNFARRGFECRHNIRYWKNWPVIGIGPAAAGWYRGQRTMNIHDVDGYIEAIERNEFAYLETQTPVPQQIAAETAVLGLRMREGINLKDYRRLTGFDLFGLYADVIEKNCAIGLLGCMDTHLYLTDLGLSFADAVAQDFVL